MWATANEGIAAHWGYKTKDSSHGVELRASRWLSGLIDSQKKSANSSDFAEGIKIDLDSDEVYLFSPKGHIYSLKTGATPIDFAYEVHTDLGDSIIGCKVNRRDAPLNIELESGQTVEIIIAKSKVEANPAWLNFVVSSKARNGIRHRLQSQKISAARKAGKVMLESELKRSGVSLSDIKASSLRTILDSIGVTSLTKLLTELGSGKRTGNIIAERFYSGLQIRKRAGTQGSNPLTILDNHIEGVSIVFAKCCMPIYGDQAIAHSDTERGIVIHHQKCKQVAPFANKDQRYMPAIWGPNKKEYIYKVKLSITTENKIGVLSDIISIFTRAGLNVDAVITKIIDQNFTGIEMDIQVKSSAELEVVMQKVRSKKTTSSCKRLINEK
jgi:guanosine-3',5'-bis(diphosphate) 3'-pyrophosphohydrolase